MSRNVSGCGTDWDIFTGENFLLSSHPWRSMSPLNIFHDLSKLEDSKEVMFLIGNKSDSEALVHFRASPYGSSHYA